MNVFSRSSAFAAVVVVALTVAGCGSNDSTAGTSSSAAVAATPSSSASTMASSAPMAGMTEMSPSMTSDAQTTTGGGEISAEHNAADVSFAQLMVEHHRGAIEMAQLAPDRAAGQQVKDLAATIEAAQTPEIELMTGWLQAWGVAMGGTGGMNMGGTVGMEMSTSFSGMPGMMTDEQMTALAASTGAEFDRMFLEMMVTHHQGAVEMADTELAQGSNPEALALAESIKTSQTAEIAQMQQLLQGL